MTRRANIFCRAQGFTFNEVLVAINITVVAILGYSLGTLGVIRGNTKSDNLTVAIHLAQDKMEQLKSQASMPNDNRCPGAGDGGITATGSPGGIFDRCWRITDSPLGANLKQIDVTVSWRDYENHDITISSLVYKGGAS